jgi:hypothetical protein
VVEAAPIQALAEFGIVFLLFTIGLNFSLPHIHALRHPIPLRDPAPHRRADVGPEQHP